MAATDVTINYTGLDASEQSIRGTFTFQLVDALDLPVVLLDPANNKTYEPALITATLDSNGQLKALGGAALTLIANDSTGLFTASGALGSTTRYRITKHLDGQDPATLYVAVPRANATFDLADIFGLTTPVTFTSSGTWTCPAGVFNVTVQCWGGGASGAAGDGVNSRGGGGGGAFAQLNSLATTPGTVYTVTVGQGGTGTTGNVNGNAGGDSWFATSGTVLAKGGAAAVSTTGGIGGAAGSCIGDVKFSGGNGGNGASVSAGGGGGGGAGAGGNGGNGSGATAGTGGAAGTGTAGGAGGTGQNGANGQAGTVLSGGGSSTGIGTTFTGGAGARGQLRLA